MQFIQRSNSYSEERQFGDQKTESAEIRVGITPVSKNAVRKASPLTISWPKNIFTPRVLLPVSKFVTETREGRKIQAYDQFQEILPQPGVKADHVQHEARPG